MRQLYRSVLFKREVCTKAKLSVFKSVFVSILTYGHECWVMTERVRSRVQAAEMGLSRKVRGLSLLDKVKSTFVNLSASNPTTPHRTIATALVWPCDTNVPRANNKATNGCSFEWQKA